MFRRHDPGRIVLCYMFDEGTEAQVLLETKGGNMMICQKLAISLAVVLVVVAALGTATEADASRTSARSARGRAIMAELRITALRDVTIDCAESSDPANTGYPTVKGDYPPFESAFADMITPGASPDEYKITRIWTVTDAVGNETVGTQTISVVDEMAPTIHCPPDVTFECDAIGDFGEATADDNGQGPPVITYEDEVIWRRCEHEYIKIRTWTATDVSGNSSSCEQTININDSTAPVIECPPDTVIACEELGSLPHAQAWDNCVEDLHMSYEPVRADEYPELKYVILRTWEVTDGCCNKVGCYQKVTLIDTIPPVLACAPDDTIPCQATPVFTDPVATDQCEPNCIVEVVSADMTTDPGDGTEKFTKCWVAYDHFGNVSERCCQTIVRLPCDGEYCTFTQGGWGNGCPKPQQDDPMSDQSGCIRDYYFDSVFPSGVTIGIPAGSTHGATWTTAGAVENFLPATGTSAALSGDLTDPETTPAGVLAGQLLALRMNSRYSCEGIFNIALNPSAGCLGTQPLPTSCAGKFAGMTVDEFLAVADSAIAGVPGVLEAHGADYSDFNETATCVNELYNTCGAEDEDEEAVDEGLIASLGGVPAEFAVESVTPNPLRSSATISYALPSEGRVRVEIFDIQGRKVASLLDEQKPAGYHGVTWNGKDLGGDSAAQGVYFCRIRFEDRPAIMHKLIKVE